MTSCVWLAFCFVAVQCEEKRGWFNLTAQEIQPLYYHTELEDQGWLRSCGCPEDAWNGGCSLLLDGLIPATHTSPVCAKCVCSLFSRVIFCCRGWEAILPPLPSLKHKCLCISQDLLPQCSPGIQDSGDPHLQAICWDHSLPGAEDNGRQCLHTHERPGCSVYVSHNSFIFIPIHIIIIIIITYNKFQSALHLN